MTTIIETSSLPFPLYRHAGTWRFLVKRGVEQLPQDCAVELDEDGLGGHVGVVSEALLNAVREKAFPRFQFSEVQSFDGLCWMHFRPLIY